MIDKDYEDIPGTFGFDADRSREWVKKPGVIFLVHNDHCTAFDASCIPAFALGCASEFKPTDEGRGPRPVPVVKSHQKLASHFAQYPAPTGNRCINLGKAVRRAIESFDEDLNVVIFGTGGMSHQLQYERADLINAEWNTRLLEMVANEPTAASQIPHLEYLREAGSEAVEMVVWHVMGGALDDEVNKVHRHYHAPASNTAGTYHSAKQELRTTP